MVGGEREFGAYRGRTIILNLAAGDGSDLSTSRGREEVFERET